MALPLFLLSPLGQVIAAAALLLIVYATSTLLVKPLTILLSNVPVVGKAIADAITGAAKGLTDWAVSWARTGIDAIVQTIAAPVQQVQAWIGELMATIQTIVARVGELLDSVANIGHQIVNIVTWIVQQFLDVGAKIAALAASIPGTVATIAGGLIASAGEALRQLIAGIVAGINAAIASEQALITRVHGDLSAAILGQGAVLTAAIGATANTLRGEIAADLRPIEAQLGELGKALEPALAIGGLGVLVRFMTDTLTLEDSCVLPTCSALGPSRGMFEALADIGMLAAVGALVGEAVHDPEGTARATAGVVRGVEGLAGDLVGALTGVHV